jgi:hypothetical protein
VRGGRTASGLGRRALVLGAAALAAAAAASCSSTLAAGRPTSHTGAPPTAPSTTSATPTTVVHPHPHPHPRPRRPAPTTSTTTSTTTTTTQPPFPPGVTWAPAGTPLPAPAALAPFSSPAVAGEGRWHPAGRMVGGHPAVYETLLRPPGSSLESGVAWMDTHLLAAQLYSGAESPGGSGWALTAPIGLSAARTLVAAFNGGFKYPAANGGYYSEGRYPWPLRNGAASLVIYKDGTATVGQWGRDVSMTPAVVAVRQNLTLLVDHGQAVPGLSPYDDYVWGATLGGYPNVWRSAVGVTADGALVYVTGPALDVPQLAALLVRAGCVRAMELDINPAWTVFATYDPPPGQPASPANGSDLIEGARQHAYTFFQSWWPRDFVTMSAR